MAEKKYDTLKHDYEQQALQLAVQYGGEEQEQQINDDQFYTIQKVDAQTDPEFPNAYDFFTFTDGTTAKLLQNPQDQQYYTFDHLQNNWAIYPLQQKIAELRQQYPPQQQQQQQQENDGQLTLKVTLTDNNTFSKYEGLLTDDEIQRLTNKNYDVQSLFEHIKDHVSKALDNIEELQLTVGDEFCTLNSKLKIQAGKQLKDFNVQCKLNKLKISREDKQDLQTVYLSKLMHKQDVKIAYLEGEVEKNKKNTQNQNQTQQQLLKIQNLESTVSFLNQQNNDFGVSFKQVQQQLQQVQQQLQQVQQQLQQVQQQKKPQPNRVSLKSLSYGDKGYLKTNILQGFYEFVTVLQDNEVEFEIGILADGDFENLETTARAFYFEFPAGKFRRGANDSDRIITYSFQRNTKIGIKVNTNEHWATASLNGYDFAPISLPESVESFAFIVKIITEGQQLGDVLEELELEQQLF